MSSTFPDEHIVDAVNDLGTTSWSGIAYRHTSIGRDPLSGEGARQFGGRWNPQGRPTIYMASEMSTCLHEFTRMAEHVGMNPLALIARGRQLHRIEIVDLPVLNLTDEDAIAHVGLDLDDFSDDDWSTCQLVGEAAHFLGFAGVAAPSASGAGVVVAAFEDRVAGQLKVAGTELLDEATYIDYLS